MYNLLRAERYKLIRNPILWILALLVVIFTFIPIFLVYLSESGMLEQVDSLEISVDTEGGVVPAGIEMFFTASNTPVIFSIVLIISVLGAFYISQAYSTGTIKNLVSAGHARFKIYMAQAIVFSVISILLMLLIPVMLAVFSAMFFGVGQWPEEMTAALLGKIVFLSSLYTVAFAAIAMFFSSISGGSGKAIALSFGFYLLAGKGLELFGNYFVLFDKLNHFNVYNRLRDITSTLR